MEEEKEIDHEYTSEIVCPYCGQEESDSWEYQADAGQIYCHNCKNEFKYEREITIEYVTSKLE